MNKDVAKKFESYPVNVRPQMLRLRELIFEVASTAKGVGELEETLKWGEPAYLTPRTKSGSTIRIDWKSKRPDQYAMYFNCKTTLVDTFRTLFPDDFIYEDNRAIVFELDQKIPETELKVCIGMALRYHSDKRAAVQ